MTTNQDRLIPLELTRGDLGWLRAHLNEGRVNADNDYKKVESLHSDRAIRAAQEALRSEHAQMTKIVEEINRLLALIDEHEARVRQNVALTPPVA